MLLSRHANLTLSHKWRLIHKEYVPELVSRAYVFRAYEDAGREGDEARVGH